MNSTINTSPMMKNEKSYTASPGYKRQHPYTDVGQSLKNSIVQKDFQLNEELEFYKARCADLDQYVRQLKTELDTTIIRLSKSGSLDEKVELVLRSNQQLSQDIDKLQKSYAQKKTECDLWKNKYEQQLNASVQLKASYEIDLRKISNELKIYEEKTQILEREKSHDIETTKTNLSIQNEQQRHNYLQQIDLLENQLRKFRDYADQRDKDVYELENKINRQNQDFEIIEGRLLKDNEHLRIKNQESEREHQIDMNGLRQKLDMLNQGQLENTKQQYITQIEIMDNEIDKLKGLLDIKNTEIDSLIIQNQRLRQNYDEELQTARMQFEILKEKMLENEQQYQVQSEQAQLHIRKANDAEVAALVQRYQNEIDILIDSVNNLKKQCENQNQSIHSLNYDKNLQLETNIKDKSHLNSTISKKHDDIEQLLKQIERLTTLIGLKDEQLEKLSDTYTKIKLGLDKQLQKLQTEFEHLQIESNSNIKKQQKEIQKLNHHIKELEQKIEHQNQQHAHQNQNHLQSIAQLKQKVVHITTSNKQLQSQVNDLTEHGQNLEQLLHEQQQKSADDVALLKSHHDKDLLLLKTRSDSEIDQVKVELAESEAKLHKVLSQVQSDSIQQNESQNQFNERLNQIQDQLEEVIDQNDLHKQLVAAYNLKAQLQHLQGTA